MFKLNFKLRVIGVIILSIVGFHSNTWAQKYLINTIVIDAGHGGAKVGAVGKIAKEKTIALKTALALGQMIKREYKNVKVIYTRTTDKNVDLHQRAELANRNKADLFISIHLNSLPKSKNMNLGVGTETFVAGTGRLNEQDVAIRENADIFTEKDYQKNYDLGKNNSPTSSILFSIMKSGARQKSLQLAKLIQKNYVKNGRKSRGVKEQNILILQRCAMPAVLTEIGFVSNTVEERFLNSSAGQEKIAKSIFDAVKEYKRLNERK